MNKFYDYLMPDMSLPAIGALVRYIRRFTAAMGGDIPVEGRMGRYGFCAAGDSQQVRVYWVQVGRQRIPVEGRMGRYGFCAAGDSQQVRVYWVQVGRQRIPVDAVI